MSAASDLTCLTLAWASVARGWTRIVGARRADEVARPLHALALADVQMQCNGAGIVVFGFGPRPALLAQAVQLSRRHPCAAGWLARQFDADPACDPEALRGVFVDLRGAHGAA